MFERFNKKSVLAGGAVLLATFGIGGAALAQSSTAVSVKAPHSATVLTEAPGQESTAPENSATDTDNVQQGDQTEAPGQESTAPENSATDTDNVQQGDQTGTDGPESASEKADGPESANDAPDVAAAGQPAQ